MTISVIIPTYKRPGDLGRCLEGLRKQSRTANELIMVVREGDEETRSLLENMRSGNTGLRIITVSAPGQVAALNAGLSAAGEDIIVFTDDDCIPCADWLQKIEAHFASDSGIGGIGGKDNVYIGGRPVTGSKKTVGKITWYGKIIGNHHLGSGEGRGVDHFKGANMAFRKEAITGIGFDGRLRGSGAQYRNDLAFCLAVKNKGWKLLYDPLIAVDHYYAERFEPDRRGNFDLEAIKNGAFNDTYITIRYIKGMKMFSAMLYSFLVGDMFLPGIAQFLRILITRQKQPWRRFSASLQGRWQACNTGFAR